MSYAALLLLGILLGYLMGHQPPQVRVEEKLVQMPRECPPAPKAEASPAKKILELRPTAVTVRNREQPPAPGRQLTLSASQISRMEQQWNDLPQQMRLAREEDGWRVTFLRGDSVFSEAGLHSGDLISDTAIEQLRRYDVNGQQLADRFYAIINHVIY